MSRTGSAGGTTLSGKTMKSSWTSGKAPSHRWQPLLHIRQLHGKACIDSQTSKPIWLIAWLVEDRPSVDGLHWPCERSARYMAITHTSTSGIYPCRSFWARAGRTPTSMWQ